MKRNEMPEASENRFNETKCRHMIKELIKSNSDTLEIK